MNADENPPPAPTPPDTVHSVQQPLEGMPGGPEPAYFPFRAGLKPCAVVIDTRNVHGQARKVFGRGLRPDAHGVRRALREYGFDAVEIYAGVATKTMTTPSSARVRSALDNNRAYAVRLAEQGAVVLSGHLTDRGGEMEEKQVDVLLALKVADLADRIRQLTASFECIVVLSEDMDLMPSFEFATQRGVIVYAAAHDTVHTRNEQTSWLILDEQVLRTICPPPANLALGAPMRAHIARVATTPPPGEPPTWKVERWDNSKPEIVLSNRRGVTGVLREASGGRVHRGDRMRLFATGIKMEPASKRFPLLVLDRERPGDGPFGGIAFAEVLYWVQPTRAKVQIEGTGAKATISASPGHLLPGQRIAVYQPGDPGSGATYYVGPVGEAPARDGWPLDAGIAVVTVTGQASQNLWHCLVDGSEVAVVVPKRAVEHATVGTRLRIALAGKTPAGTHLGQPLTCCLPGS